MPGKHAPATSKSFLISLGTAAGGALAALALVVGIALVVTHTGTKTNALTTPPPTPSIVHTHRASTVAPTRTPTSVASTSVADVKLRILNATTRKGLAASLATRAQNEGYPPALIGDYPTKESISKIYYRAGSQQDALGFQQRFPEFTEVHLAPSTFKTDVNLTIIIGADYPGDTTSPTPTAT
ncbi:MAG: LytR C-terminal domain-containing protein [Actinomycetota bacterium]